MTNPGRQGQITASSIVVASEEQVASDLDGETVVLSLESARYFGLQGAGPRIWELVRQPVRVSEVCDAIASEYDVTPERCESDVLTFLRELLGKGLIKLPSDA
jgi:hypothetical protein